ncbi:MAG: helix-turn-helix transcriptional regulator [Cytophagaceae bacterium]|jgi:transcriptional regulator with XRE-family HTH domain
MDKEVFGQVLRDYRLKKKLTQERLAEMAELHHTYIYRMESGLREPSLGIFIKLIECLGISSDEFLSNYKKQLRKSKK